MKSGIYHILCENSMAVYVGMSEDILKRWEQHESDMIKGAHCNSGLQSAYNHPDRKLSFYVRDFCHPDLLRFAEAMEIRRLRALGVRLLNIQTPDLFPEIEVKIPGLALEPVYFLCAKYNKSPSRVLNEALSKLAQEHAEEFSGMYLHSASESGDSKAPEGGGIPISYEVVKELWERRIK